MTTAQERFEYWLTNLTGDALAELQKIQNDQSAVQECFHSELAFGTAGLRGILGLGSGRMNSYTVRHATQGFSQYLLEACASTTPSVAIAYDSRRCSQEFAREAACVFAANGLTVHMYRQLMPTPALSYAVRELHCDAGVVITASHNPAEYNGYKAYDHTGCQLNLQAAEKVMQQMQQCDLFSAPKHIGFSEALADGKIRWIPEEFVQRYLARVLQESLQPKHIRDAGLKIVYTPLNGAGNRPVRTVLERAGIANMIVVPEQELPDSSFSTCPYPNPEVPEALRLGLALCRKTGAELLIATDPDCDRIAVAVPSGADYTILTGNEAGVLLIDYIARTRKALGTLPANAIAVKSIVSSHLAQLVAEEYGITMVNVLTGFKYIGGIIHELELAGQADRFVFAFEESCGYLTGAYVRDKDAVNAALLLAEAASAYKLQGQTLLDVLNDIYARHGIFRNIVDSHTFAGVQGLAAMKTIMAQLRQSPPAAIAGDPVAAYTDYLAPATAGQASLPPADMLEYTLQNGCSIIVRPSGTEPKIKIYYSLVAKSQKDVDALAARYRLAGRQLLGLQGK